MTIFFQEAGWCAIGTHHDLAATDILILLEHRTVGGHNACLDQHQGIRQALVAFIIGKVNRNITADGIQLLAGRNLVHEGDVIPTEAEDARRICFTSFLDGSGNDFFHERFRIFTNGYRSDNRQGNTYRIMCVTITATGHHKSLGGIVHHLGLACFNKCFDAFLVAYIDILTIFHRKGFDNLIVFGSENLTIDHKVSAGFYGSLFHIYFLIVIRIDFLFLEVGCCGFSCVDLQWGQSIL